MRIENGAMRVNMRRRWLCLSWVFFMATASYASDGNNWSYAGESGPSEWARIEPGSACGGSAQSPVNIIVSDTEPFSDRTRPLLFDYSPQTMLKQVTNNGSSIQYDFAEGDAVEYQGKRFKLIQVHFHSPSEHMLNGVRYPLELHFVHLNETDQQYTVLAILGYEGKPIEKVKFLEEYLPSRKNQTVDIQKKLDLRSMFPRNLTPRFEYSGSLTTPPCSEGVNWVVFQDPLELTKAYVDALRSGMPVDNYRGPQPLNDRTVNWIVN